MMFLGRRGVAVTPGLRRLIHPSFVLSYGMVLLLLHGAQSEAPVPYETGGVASSLAFLPLGIHGVVADTLCRIAGTAFLVSSVASLA